MTPSYKCDICGTNYPTPDLAYACEAQPVQSLLLPETRVTYHGRVCKIGYRHFLNCYHERVYLISTVVDDIVNVVNSSIGYVIESEFTVL